MKYELVTFGCQVNISDSERISAFFEKQGYKETASPKDADFLIINMCCVRQSAVDRIYGKIEEIKNEKQANKKLKSILTGCILKKDEKKFAKNFDYILKKEDMKEWPKILGLTEKKYCNFFNIKPISSNRFTALIPISSGCNNYCSYCVVPYVRGNDVSRPVEDILKEVKTAIKGGAKDIWLLGQNVNSYKHKTTDFPKLLRMANNIPGNFWIRFTSPHPKDFSDELIKVMAGCKKVTPYLNLPLQSGDDTILKKMNRPYTAKKYKALVKKIRKQIPGITISTDIIVGFPGETKKQFDNTAKLFKEIKFDMAYLSIYSSRPGTKASEMEDTVTKKEKKRRKEYLNEILKKTALENNKKFIGRTEEVLPLEEKNGFLFGKSLHYKSIKFKGPKSLIGKFIKIKIVDALPWKLVGE